jgi:hypothetical protein
MRPKFNYCCLLLLAAAISFAAACEENKGETPYLKADVEFLTFSAWASSKTVSVKSTVSFTAVSSQPDWCEVAAQSGAIKVSVNENPLTEDRTALITLAAKGANSVEIAVRQDGERPSYNLITCGQDQVYIIDEKTSTSSDLAIVWSWNLSEAGSQLPSAYKNHLRTLDDCKPVDNNTKLLLTSSNSGGVLLLEYATKKCLFYAQVSQAHSAEWLPGGKVAVVLSTDDNGNRINVYDSKLSEQVLFSEALTGGHGVVWIPERDRLYVLGSQELREYSLKDWETSSPKLVREKTWYVPGTNGHDLSRVNASTLLLSSKNVYSFSIDAESFTLFKPDKLAGSIKSVNYVEDDDWVVYTQAANADEYWNHYIYMLNPDKVLTLPESYRMYKVRLMKND